VVACWQQRPATLADLTALRVTLRELLRGGPLAVAEDESEWLLLVVEELASNGLRHGRLPVTVSVTATATDWLVTVTDGAPERAPTPAVGRDAARGGLGLPLVARLSIDHGWTVEGPSKHVWACIDRAS
jgi:anti-sigma regulatory factor (Ser/Thr protein kinase)